MSEVDRDEAWRLFCEWTESDSLRKHVLGVEAAMVAYAREYGEDEELWAATGILHDLDYERYPDLDTGHPLDSEKFPVPAPAPPGAPPGGRPKLGSPEELIAAVPGPPPSRGVPR